ncbi:MAG: PHP-associated domain-containing protein [Candidatus Bathyarchaeia archaeon]
MILRIDTHIHTTMSADAYTQIEQIPLMVRLKGIDGVAITDHDKFSNHQVEGMIIIPGIEVSAMEGHILALGNVGDISPGLSVDETVRLIHERGGVAVLAHPYDIVRGGIKPSMVSERLDGIETINSRANPFRLSKYLAERASRRLGLPTFGGSDSHTPDTIGDAYTCIDSDSGSLADILDAIRKGRVRAAGGPTCSMDILRKVRNDVNRRLRM